MLPERIRLLFFGNIKRKQLFIYYVVSSIITAIFTFFSFALLLGRFYKAVENTILTNIFVWVLMIIICYIVVYVIHFVVIKFNKKLKKNYGPLINFWAIAAGYLIILFVCLGNSYQMDDYLFVQISGSMAAFFGAMQMFIDLSRKVNKKNEKEK